MSTFMVKVFMLKWNIRKQLSAFVGSTFNVPLQVIVSAVKAIEVEFCES